MFGFLHTPLSYFKTHFGDTSLIPLPVFLHVKNCYRCLWVCMDDCASCSASSCPPSLLVNGLFLPCFRSLPLTTLHLAYWFLICACIYSEFKLSVCSGEWQAPFLLLKQSCYFSKFSSSQTHHLSRIELWTDCKGRDVQQSTHRESTPEWISTNKSNRAKCPRHMVIGAQQPKNNSKANMH